MRKHVCVAGGEASFLSLLDGMRVAEEAQFVRFFGPVFEKFMKSWRK
jgi:hypothetical protein